MSNFILSLNFAAHISLHSSKQQKKPEWTFLSSKSVHGVFIQTLCRCSIWASAAVLLTVKHDGLLAHWGHLGKTD